MSVYFLPDELVLNRIPEPVDVSWQIKQYGESNLYPQIVHSIMLRSPLTKSAVSLLADFFRGDGFTNNQDLVVNRYGETLNDVLKKSAEDLAEFRGFAFHLNYNVAGLVVEMTPIPFEYIRLGVPDASGISTTCKVSNNWENVNRMYLNTEQDGGPEEFDLWDPMKNKVSRKGNIFYYSDRGRGRYPLCSFDPILDNAQSDAEIQKFEVNNLTNGFHSGTIFKHYGPFEDDRAKDRFLDQINTMTGAKGGASSMVVEVDEALENAQLIEQLPANNNDNLFTQTTANIRNRVLQYFNIPGGLFAVSPDNSVFTVTELGPSFVYMNLRTKNDRRTLERAFNRFADAGEIITNSFDSDRTLEQAPTPNPAPNE